MRAIVVANWKMNPGTFRDAKRLFDASKRAVDAAKSVAVIVAPPAIYLRDLATAYKGKKLSFAVQNAHFESAGAHTGEVSMEQARDAKASYALVGHAERRAAGETNEDTRKKVAAALASRLTPILCVGERQRSSAGEYFNDVRAQLLEGLRDVPANALQKVMIAYEPVWAIGADQPMTPGDMHEMSIFIRKAIVETAGQVGMKVKILYGGSIDDSSAAAMMQDGGVQGLLIGRASLEPRVFAPLLLALNDA
jgi:triosephosphate isomerase